MPPAVAARGLLQTVVSGPTLLLLTGTPAVTKVYDMYNQVAATLQHLLLHQPPPAYLPTCLPTYY